MFKKTFAVLGVSLIAATPALAVDGPFPVRDVDSITFFESMKNPNALEYYPDVAADVATAVSEKVDLAPDDNSRALDLDIRITSMRLNDNPVLTDDGKFNILEGLVAVRDDASGEVVTSQAILLNAEEMAVPYDSISPENNDFYNAMVLAFADKTAEITNSVTTLEDLDEARN